LSDYIKIKLYLSLISYHLSLFLFRLLGHLLHLALLAQLSQVVLIQLRKVSLGGIAEDTLPIAFVFHAEGFQLVMLQHPPHFFDFQLANSVFLFFFFELLIQLLKLCLTVLDLLLPLAHLCFVPFLLILDLTL
jgi:hypothetical protein